MRNVEYFPLKSDSSETHLICGMLTIGAYRMLPEYPCLADSFESRAFCGTYSRDGSIFISGVQGRRYSTSFRDWLTFTDIFSSFCVDNCLYLYDTAGRKFKRYKSVQARDVGWSILDTTIR